VSSVGRITRRNKAHHHGGALVRRIKFVREFKSISRIRRDRRRHEHHIFLYHYSVTSVILFYFIFLGNFARFGEETSRILKRNSGRCSLIFA
jgi:hypothetical protein